MAIRYRREPRDIIHLTAEVPPRHQYNPRRFSYVSDGGVYKTLDIVRTVPISGFQDKCMKIIGINKKM